MVARECTRTRRSKTPLHLNGMESQRLPSRTGDSRCIELRLHSKRVRMNMRMYQRCHMAQQRREWCVYKHTHTHTCRALSAHHGLHKFPGSQFRKAGWGALDLWTQGTTGEKSMKATRHSSVTRGLALAVSAKVCAPLLLEWRAAREGEAMTKLIIFNAAVKTCGHQIIQ